MLAWFVLSIAALAAPSNDSELVWNLFVDGQPVGTRELTVRRIGSDTSAMRILESYTNIDFSLGNTPIQYRQRLTASVQPGEPAAFHSVVDQNGSLLEVQARWTPSAWVVSTTENGATRTVDMPVDRVHMSTADLFDPDNLTPISRHGNARLLFAELGTVNIGSVEKLGTSETLINNETVQVTGFAWTGPAGRSEFFYSTDGYLVSFTLHLAGIGVRGTLAEPPPAGVDDFPVRTFAPDVRVIDL